MNTKIIPIGCSLTADEYKKFKEICEKNSTYPSAAIRETMMEWMEKRKEVSTRDNDKPDSGNDNCTWR